MVSGRYEVSHTMKQLNLTSSVASRLGGRALVVSSIAAAAITTIVLLVVGVLSAVSVSIGVSQGSRVAFRTRVAVVECGTNPYCRGMVSKCVTG